jgi:hypothetical protein
MQLLSNILKSSLAFLLSFSLFFVTGCEDDDHDHDHDEDHTDADGFILEDASGSEVYREFEGAVTGGVTLAVGDTLELSVHFLDHEGNEIEHEEEDHEEEDHEEEDHDGDEDGIEVSGADASIAIVEVESHEEEEDGDHDEEDEHGNALHVIGVSTGSTSFQLQLMHDGHADYTSTNNVTVTVQ